jgi:hypothetical protein
MLYNILFTAYNIGWFATYDKEINYDELEKNPKYYKKGLKKGYFNKIIFWRWYFYGLVAGILIYIQIVETFKKDDLEELSIIGHSILMCIVLVVNFKLLIKTRTHNIYSVILFFFSVSSYFVILYLTNNMIGMELFNVFQMTMSNLSLYITVVFVLAACMMAEYAWENGVILFKSLIEIIKKTLNDIQIKKKNLRQKKIQEKIFQERRKKEKEEKIEHDAEFSKEFQIDFFKESINRNSNKLLDDDYDYDNYDKVIVHSDANVNPNQTKNTTSRYKFSDISGDDLREDRYSLMRNGFDKAIMGKGIKCIKHLSLFFLFFLLFIFLDTGFCPPEDKPDTQYINQLLIENFFDQKIKEFNEDENSFINEKVLDFDIK